MRKLVYYIGLSIDGFIAGLDDQLDFYPVSDEYAELMTAEFAEALPTHVRQQLRIDSEPTRGSTPSSWGDAPTTLPCRRALQTPTPTCGRWCS
jgi:hypothetical protein